MDVLEILWNAVFKVFLHEHAIKESNGKVFSFTRELKSVRTVD